MAGVSGGGGGGSSGGEQRSSSYHHHHHHHLGHHPPTTSSQGPNHSPLPPPQPPAPSASYSRSADTPDTGSITAFGHHQYNDHHTICTKKVLNTSCSGRRIMFTCE